MISQRLRHFTCAQNLNKYVFSVSTIVRIFRNLEIQIKIYNGYFKNFLRNKVTLQAEIGGHRYSWFIHIVSVFLTVIIVSAFAIGKIHFKGFFDVCIGCSASVTAIPNFLLSKSVFGF